MRSGVTTGGLGSLGSDRTRRVLRLNARSVTILAATALLLIVSSCSQTIGAGSRRLGNGSIGTLVVSHAQVLLLPPVGGGEGGWCMTTAPGKCPSLYSRPVSYPIVAETWGGQGPPPVDEGVVLTRGEVAVVSVNGSRAIPTWAESVLPDHLRAAVVELRGRSLFALARRPRFTVLDSSGTAIPQTTAPHPQLVFRVPSRTWKHPASAPRGICGLKATPLAGLVAGGGSVMTEVRPHREVFGREFVSCASTAYLFKNWPIVAGVLLDASHPGTTPASLPAMQPLQGHPGIFQGPGVEGETIARRIAGAWLVVAKGEGLQQRLTLLEHMHAMVRLVR
jgi:hypothetical protein